MLNRFLCLLNSSNKKNTGNGNIFLENSAKFISPKMWETRCVMFVKCIIFYLIFSDNFNGNYFIVVDGEGDPGFTDTSVGVGESQ